MKTSVFDSFSKHIIIWALILFSSREQLMATIDAEVDEIRIIPRTTIEKIPGPMRIFDYLVNQLPEDKKGVESLTEGMRKDDTIFRYGNWYGPGWWGGGTDKDKPGNMEPVDELDAAAQRHDYGYLVAEKMGKIYGKAEEYRLKAIADAIAVEDARRLDPDPSKWDPPASDPEKASRYRDRIITGFHYEAMAYEKAWEAGRGGESWEMRNHNQKLDREYFERHVQIHVDHWKRTNEAEKEETLEDLSDDQDDNPDDASAEDEKPASQDSDPGGKSSVSEAKDESQTVDDEKKQPEPRVDDDGLPGVDADDPSATQADDDPQTPVDDSVADASAKDDTQADAKDDDGLIHGAPSGDESDAYGDGARVIDDDGTEYEKSPDGSWEETGDKYDPITKEQKDAWDKEIEDARRKLKDQEASSDGSIPGSDDSSGSDGNIIDDYADTYQEKQKIRNEVSADNMDLNQQIKSSSTSGDQQIYDAKKIVSSGGRDAKDIKDSSAAKTAQKESDDSWGNMLGDAVSDGVQKGLEDFASTFGSEAAEDAAAQIFDGGKKKKPAPSSGAIASAAPGPGGSGRAAPKPSGGQGAPGGGTGGARADGGSVPADGGDQDGAKADGSGLVADGEGLAEELANEVSVMPTDEDEDFDKTGDSVTVTEDASAGDGGGSANTGSSASGGFAKGYQDRAINGSGALAGKKVTGVTVNLSYQAYSIPDSFSIIYEGKMLGASGMTSGSSTISGRGAGSSSSVTIRVLSHQEETTTKWKWSAEVTFHTR